MVVETDLQMAEMKAEMKVASSVESLAAMMAACSVETTVVE